MRRMRTTFGALAAIAGMVTAATPALDNCEYGCTIPGVTNPETIVGKSVDARQLVMFLQERGVLEVRSDGQKTLTVQPRYALAGSSGREILAQGTGTVTEVRVGRHPISAIDGYYSQLQRTLERFYPGQHIRVASVTTLDYGAPLRIPGDHFALTLEFMNAKAAEGGAMRSHKLVFFMGSPVGGD